MSKTKVLVNFIQDRSGSMQSVWQETLSGFKSFVKDLKDGAEKDGIEYLFSLTPFDTLIETPMLAVPIGSVANDALAKFGPRGGTALYDAVGATIKATEDSPVKPDKIICVIVTDGQENSSREWNKDRLQKAIESRLADGNWTFTYLGTQPETWGDASAIGIGVGASASYVGANANMAYANVAGAVRSMSASASMGTRNLMSEHTTVESRLASHMRLADDPIDMLADGKYTPPPQPPSQVKQPRDSRWR